MTPVFRLLVGDVMERLSGLPDESVHCVVTSPPYWGLRDYGVPGQLGLEATPDEFVARMVEVFREVRRVLRDDGTLWLNLGDSYVGAPVGSFNGGGFKDGSAASGGRDMSGVATSGTLDKTKASGLKPKDLVGIPWRVAFALQADGWWLRSEIIWAKPNPMPESVTDRPTKAHEQVFLLTKSARYFYDADAVRDGWTDSRNGASGSVGSKYVADCAMRQDGGVTSAPQVSGRNLRSVWSIPTEPYPGAHFATFPTKLVEPCVKAGSSEHGCCPECGAPWERETERELTNTEGWGSAQKDHHGLLQGSDAVTRNGQGRAGDSRVTTTGWLPGCDHQQQPVPCTVLDPFLGSGTTAYVALALGRSCIGIELNEEYARLAERRVASWGPKRARLAQMALGGVTW